MSAFDYTESLTIHSNAEILLIFFSIFSNYVSCMVSFLELWYTELIALKFSY